MSRSIQCIVEEVDFDVCRIGDGVSIDVMQKRIEGKRFK